LIVEACLISKCRDIVCGVGSEIVAGTWVWAAKAAQVVVCIVVAGIVAGITEAAMLWVLRGTTGLIVVVVVDDLDWTIAEAAHAWAGQAEAVKHRLDAFEGERTCGDSGGGLEGSSKKAGLRAGCVGHCIGRGLVQRGSVLRRRWSVLRRYLLVAHGGCLLLSRRLLGSLTEETAEEADVVRGLRALLLELLDLLLKLAQLSLGLIEGNVLDEHRLGEHVQGVRISGKALVQQGLCIGILFRERSLVQAIDEGAKKLFFLGSQEYNLRRSFS
jgi:hypothetical protein